MPNYEEYQIPDIKEYDPKAFSIFAKECNQDIESTIKGMDTLHVEFSGNMVKGKKEGKGGFRCEKTNDFYYGGW